MSETAQGPRVTAVIVLPESRADLERLVTDLIRLTPDGLYDVAVVDTGAPADVVEFAKMLEGDVITLDAPGAGLDEVLERVRARTSTEAIVPLDARVPLRWDWLAGAVGAEHLRTLQPPVLADLGPRFLDDLSALLDQLSSGRAAVGSLPVAAAERMRERLEMEEERRLLELARAGRDVCWVGDDCDEPLVTVRVATYNRGEMVADVAMASVLAQTYENWELVVVGDDCDEATERAVRSVKDKRITFVNLPVRGTYPREPFLRWQVAGSAPVNLALQLARGSWIAPLDDDDAFTPDHIERLLSAARARRLEHVWSVAEMEAAPGVWGRSGANLLWHHPGQPGGDPSHIVHGSVLYSAGLRFMRYSNTCWKYQPPEPADQNMWRRMAAIGVRMGFVDSVTYRHNLETPQREAMPQAR